MNRWVGRALWVLGVAITTTVSGSCGLFDNCCNGCLREYYAQDDRSIVLLVDGEYGLDCEMDQIPRSFLDAKYTLRVRIDGAFGSSPTSYDVRVLESMLGEQPNDVCDGVPVFSAEELTDSVVPENSEVCLIADVFGSELCSQEECGPSLF